MFDSLSVHAYAATAAKACHPDRVKSMHDDDMHLSQIQTAWSMVRRAHGDHTAVHAAQQSLLDRYGGAVRRYALASLRDEDGADEVSQEFALRFVRGDFGNADPGRGRFRSFVKTIVYRLIVDYQRRQKKRSREGSMHSNIAEQVAESDQSVGDDAMFQSSWRDELLARCWQKLAEEEQRTGKPHHTVLALPGRSSGAAFAGTGGRPQRKTRQARQRRRGTRAVAPGARRIRRAAARRSDAVAR